MTTATWVLYEKNRQISWNVAGGWNSRCHITASWGHRRRRHVFTFIVLRNDQRVSSQNHSGPAISLETESYNSRIFTCVVSYPMSHTKTCHRPLRVTIQYCMYPSAQQNDVIRSTYYLFASSCHTFRTCHQLLRVPTNNTVSQRTTKWWNTHEDGFSARNFAAASEKFISN
jgi:hypothetical protein